jgi:pyridoxamine 5'-phosphate oxidase
MTKLNGVLLSWFKTESLQAYKPHKKYRQNYIVFFHNLYVHSICLCLGIQIRLLAFHLARKAKQISENQNVSLLFPWFPLERQVIILGVAAKISSAESDKYFASRPRGSQIGAWASMQSTELSDRSVLENKFAQLEEKWPIGTTIPRPDYWGGYVVLPTSIEFWQGRYSRLHDRIRYVRSENNDWQIKRFYP